MCMHDARQAQHFAVLANTPLSPFSITAGAHPAGQRLRADRRRGWLAVHPPPPCHHRRHAAVPPPTARPGSAAAGSTSSLGGGTSTIT